MRIRTPADLGTLFAIPVKHVGSINLPSLRKLESAGFGSSRSRKENLMQKLAWCYGP